MQATHRIRALPAIDKGGSDAQPLQTFTQRWLSFLAKARPDNWERVTVNKNVDSVTMPKWIAVAILTAFLAFMVQSWWARSADHDAMIRIETRLEEAVKAAEKAQTEQNLRNGDMQAWREVMNGKLSEIKGMLTQQQIEELNKSKRKNGG